MLWVKMNNQDAKKNNNEISQLPETKKKQLEAEKLESFGYSKFTIIQQIIEKVSPKFNRNSKFK